MYGQMTSPEGPNQMYHEWTHAVEQQQLARRVMRERRAARKQRRVEQARAASRGIFRTQRRRLVPRQVG